MPPELYTDVAQDSDEPADDSPADSPPDDPPSQAWIGSPCSSDADCSYEGGFCFTEAEGFPSGHCTMACDLYCPDQDGYPVTFCTEIGDLTGGLCVSRCDSDYFPDNDGCRDEYACVTQPRFTEPSTVEPVCVPEELVPEDTGCTDPTNQAQDDDCYFELASYGDPNLEDLLRRLLAGTATVDDAWEFLELDYAYSQDFIHDELGKSTIAPNYSSGHSSSYPMRGMVVHYTANQREDDTIKYFVTDGADASTHFVIGSYRNGLIVQVYSHQDRSWHAGSDYNIDHFGFDFANAGYLVEQSDGSFVDYAERTYVMDLPVHGDQPVWVDDGIPSAPEPGKYDNRQWWQPYTYHQVLSFVAVGRALDHVYGLDPEMIRRHGDIADSRVDPGPQLPFTYLAELVFSDEDVFEVGWLDDYKWDAEWITLHPEAR